MKWVTRRVDPIGCPWLKGRWFKSSPCNHRYRQADVPWPWYSASRSRSFRGVTRVIISSPSGPRGSMVSGRQLR
jgi:hypothetical protein